jgi:putative transcriptional regulator
MATPSLAGRLLVAIPTLPDPNFERSVVLLLDHEGEGAVGVILNRPTDASLPAQLPGWASLAAAPAVVFVGGPVAPDAAIGLGRADPAVAQEGFLPLPGGSARAELGTVDLSLVPADAAPTVTEVRVFAGYAGWGAGQLEIELARGDWIVVDAEPGDAFCDEPDELWRAVLRRQRGPLSRLARFPDDLSMN